MPSKSKKQHNLMAAVANNPAFAKKVGISKSVGEEFMKADKTKKFIAGGSTGSLKEVIKKEEVVIYPQPNHFSGCNCFKCVRWKNQNAK